ncbi:MAG: exopolyphosphatase [Alphaproteobacteria bacterium]|nr:exopolyphosphatase [Alphaproteobacteria bacterium]TAD91466.1 MAG: exopolyphosphatase [Alphaproteobacteria bacterium]
MGDKYRLVTRSDFDGLVCAVLLRDLGLIDDISFVHPKDMQDGKIAVSGRDIVTNLPYQPSAYLCFDHHASEETRLTGAKPNLILDPLAPSAARVVWNHFGGRQRFADVSEEMMQAVDQADSAQYTIEDILAPEGWTLLNFIMDPRTGLGRYKHFRISNYDLMMDLIVHCRNPSIQEILAIPDVQERVLFYLENAERAEHQLRRICTVHQNVAFLDTTGEEELVPANRFLIYALYPECNVSVHRLWGLHKQNTVFAVGHSITNRTCKTRVGDLMLSYGGGGHDAAGTCQVANPDAARVERELIETLIRNG